MHFQSYAVIGTGALGGYYGGRLQQAGAEVHFLLRSDYEHVRRHGLRIESIAGNFELPRVKAYRQAADMPPCEVVLVTLKSTQNHWLPELLPPLVKDDTIVAVLQNGLGIEAEAAAIVGPDKVVGGLCFICSNKVGPGHIRHLDYGQITLGEYTADDSAGGVTTRLQSLAADLEQARIPVALADDLVTARWKKLVWNIPFNGLSVVLDAATDALIRCEQTRLLAIGLMQEVLAAAAAVHQRHIPASFIQDMVAATAQMQPYRTSMKLDYDAGRPLEVEAIFGRPLRLAQAAGLKVEYLEMIYRQLKFLDSRARG
jgi:2-dehydropantoate 2-reductase